MDEWSRRHIEALVAIEETVGGALEGDTLLNNDIRADNILLTPGRTWFVDWPHASVGPPWLDVVAFAPSVAMQGGPSPEEVISRHSACRSAESDGITAVVVTLAGYFTHKAVQPPPPGLPTVRAFQNAQGVVARKWVAQRTGLSYTGGYIEEVESTYWSSALRVCPPSHVGSSRMNIRSTQ